MKPNFDTDEKDFMREFDSSLAEVRAKAGPCPHPDLLMAAGAGVQFENRDHVLKHLNVCSVCQQLVRDLSDYEFPGVTKEEDRRIRARWETEGAARRPIKRLWAWPPIAIGAAAAAAVIAIALFLTARQTAPPRPVESAQVNKDSIAPPPAPPQRPRTAFIMSKAAIKVPAAAVLNFRSGAEDSKTFLNEFATALAPYRNDEYVEAARRLETLSTKYRESAEVYFYLGVSRLFIDRNDEALASLETARRFADETLRDDISWYLALALDRVRRDADARREVDGLCSHAGNYQKTACAALEELR
jgi:hypothetical protein